MKLDLDLLIDKSVAVNCKSKKEEELFLNYLDSKGYTWASGEKIYKLTYYFYEDYGTDTCFVLVQNKLRVLSIGYYKSKKYKILSLDDLIIKNNFKDYGFEANFKGEILKETLDNYKRKIYVGYYVGNNNVIYPCVWDSIGQCDFCCSARYQERNLKPIKKEWYKQEDNFISYKDKLIINKYGNIRKIQYIDTLKVSTAEQNMYHDILRTEDWRLATKEEIEKYIY